METMLTYNTNSKTGPVCGGRAMLITNDNCKCDKCDCNNCENCDCKECDCCSNN